MKKKNVLELNDGIEELVNYGFVFEINERKALIAERLRELREATDKTQSEIASYIKIKTGTYSTYENGTRETPVEVLVRLSILYNIPIDVLVQKDRYSKENYIADRQIEDMQKDIEEIKTLLTGNDELKPEAKEFLTTMSEYFAKATEELAKINSSIKPTQND